MTLGRQLFIHTSTSISKNLFPRQICVVFCSIYLCEQLCSLVEQDRRYKTPQLTRNHMLPVTAVVENLMSGCKA
jgi:hypothetical protein